MAPAKKAAKKAPAKKAAGKKATAKKAPAKKAAAKKSAGKKAPAKKATASSGGSGASLLTASKVKDAIRSQDVRMSGDFTDALNAEVHEMISKAVRRAKDNNRGTVRPADL